MEIHQLRTAACGVGGFGDPCFPSPSLFESSLIHLLGNMVVQILIGVPLEVVHKPWRIGTLYFMAVLSGIRYCTRLQWFEPVRTRHTTKSIANGIDDFSGVCRGTDSQTAKTQMARRVQTGPKHWSLLYSFCVLTIYSTGLDALQDLYSSIPWIPKCTLLVLPLESTPS